MRRLFVIPAITLFFVILAGSALSAEKWTLFATDEDGVRHYYDENSVKWVGEDAVHAWDKWELSGEDRGEFMHDTGREAIGVRSLVEIRCRHREQRSVKIVYHGVAGDEILSFSDPAAVWEDILPGSVTDSLHSALCVHGRFTI